MNSTFDPVRGLNCNHTIRRQSDGQLAVCLCDNCRRIFSWLDQQGPDPPAEQAALDADDAVPPTPPESSSQPPPRSRSPAKRRRLDPAEEAVDTDEAVDSRPLQLRPLAPLAAKRPGRRRRSVSPIKSLLMLRSLVPPVQYTAAAIDAETQLPEDVMGLFKKIRRVTEFRSGFISDGARDLVAKLAPEARDWPPHFFAPETAEDGQLWTHDSEPETEPETTDLAAFRRAKSDLLTLRKIQRRAAESEKLSRSESAWNALVHTPLLDLATRCRRGVASEQITTATIVPVWRPQRRDGGEQPPGEAPPSSSSAAYSAATDEGQSQSTTTTSSGPGNMVDFALVLALDDPPHNRSPGHAALAKKVGDMVMGLPFDTYTINQSIYGPLQNRPAGVMIETKGATGQRDGRIQLAVWVAAWHQRMRALAGHHRQRFITIPLVLTSGHSWSLYFACDRGDEKGIEMVGSLQIGGTANLLDLYTLLAVLRHLVAWMDGPFKEWMMDFLGVGDDEE